MRKQIYAVNRRSKQVIAGARNWLRRVMLHVAILATALYIIWLLVHNSRIYREHGISVLFDVITFLIVSAAAVYYGLKGLFWLKRRLLWRVRRRLVITYLFVGLTPIVLLVSLGILFAITVSVNNMARIVTMQLQETSRLAATSARNLTAELTRLPANADDSTVKSLLDRQIALLQSSLPGARLAVWRGAPAGEDLAAIGHSRLAQFVSEPADAATRGVGNETTPPGASLPGWLRGRDTWSGLTFIRPPGGSGEPFDSPSVRALVRGGTNDRPVTLLLVVPVSRALVQHLRERTNIEIHPFFYEPAQADINSNADLPEGESSHGVHIKVEQSQGAGEERVRRTVLNLRKNQLGEPMQTPLFAITVSATNWLDGQEANRLAFLFHWTFPQAVKEIYGSSQLGEGIQKVLLVISSFFLVLELLALLSAAWMTRAVTGTVHRLYQATEFIKRGDFSHRVRVRSHDQLGELAEAFNDMSANVEALLHERVERERLEREVEIAAEVQAQLFPRSVPDLRTAEIAAECRAARGVAGDYYDYVEIVPGLVAVALGDVSGKGISASLVMSNLQAALRAQATITAERLSMAERPAAISVGGAGDGGKLPAHLAAEADIDGVASRMTQNINGQLCQSTEANRFVTLFLAVYEDNTRTLRYTNAGHNAAILVRADGSLERLATGGVVVGAFDWAEYEEASTTLNAGDLLLIFSDGISEAERATGEEYGEARLEQFAVEHGALSASEMRHALFAEIDAWCGAQERGDDQTLVILKSSESGV